MIKRIFPGMFHRHWALSRIRAATDGHAHRNARLGHSDESFQSTIAKKTAPSIVFIMSTRARDGVVVLEIQPPGHEDLVTGSRATMTSAGSGQTRCLYSDPISGLTCFAMTVPDYLAMSSRLLPDCIFSDAQAPAGSSPSQLTPNCRKTCLLVHSFRKSLRPLHLVIV